MGFVSFAQFCKANFIGEFMGKNTFLLPNHPKSMSSKGANVHFRASGERPQHETAGGNVHVGQKVGE